MLYTRRVIIVTTTLRQHPKLLAIHVRRRRHRVRGDIPWKCRPAKRHGPLLELVTDRRRRRKIIKVRRRVHHLPVQAARRRRRLLLLLLQLLAEEVAFLVRRREGVVDGAVRVDVSLRVAPAGVVVMGEVEGRRWRCHQGFHILLLVVFAQEVVLGLVDEEEDGGDAGELGADEAAHVEDEGVAVGVFEGGGEQLGAGSQFAAYLRFEDGDVHYQAEEHHQTLRKKKVRLFL